MEETKKRELFTQGLQIRENESSEEDAVIEGVAIVAEVETVLYEEPNFREIEVIDASALDMDFFATQDIKLNLLHERLQSLARSNKGVGTLEYEIRGNELAFRAPAPKCDLGAQAVALIRNKTYTGCSFEFWPNVCEYSERIGADGKREYVCRIKSFEYVTAFTIAMDPAYKQTSINAREAYLAQHKNEDSVAAEEPNDSYDAVMKREREREARIREIELSELTYNSLSRYNSK